jgi:PAS domain S-box-containing protein
MGMTRKDTFKRYFWHIRMPLVIIALGILSASFLYLINRNIESTHQHTMRADILMDVTNKTSQAHVELMHYIGGTSVDTDLIERELSESRDLMEILLDGGVCAVGSPLEPLEDNVLRLQVEVVTDHLSGIQTHAGMLLGKSEDNKAELMMQIDRLYSGFLLRIGALEDEIERALVKSSHDTESLIKNIAPTWFAVILISTFWLWRYETQDVRTRESLRQGEEKYRNLFESATDAIFILDLEGNFIDVNSTAHTRLGYTKDEMLSMHIKELDPPEFAARVPERLAEIQNKGVAVFESAHIRKDGTVTPVEVNSRILDYEGRQVYFSIIRDITERKEAEEAFIESEMKFKTLADKSPSMIFINKMGKIVYANMKCEEVMGYSLEKMYSPDFNYLDLIVPEHVEMVKDKFMKHLKGEDIPSYEYAMVTKDGRRIEAIITTKLIQYEGEDAILGIVTDITERKQAEEEIRLKAQIVDQVHDSIITTNMNGLITSWNRGAAKLYGYTTEEAIGKHIAIIYPEERHEFLEDQIIAPLKEKGTHELDDLCLKKSGELVNTHLSLSFIRNPEGVPVEMIGYSTDITKRKKAETQIAASLKEKEVLLKEIHHRVKNNMAIVSALLQLQAKFSSEENVKRLLKDSQSRIGSMALVHEKLYQTQNFVNINFREYVEELASHLLETYGKKKGDIGLLLSIDDISLNIDTMIPCGLILNELVTNSLKYAFEGIEKPEISISLERDNNQGTLVYSDNGTGIPAHVDFPSSKSLGLQIISMLSLQLKGKVELERDNGTRFIIKLELQHINDEPVSSKTYL